MIEESDEKLQPSPFDFLSISPQADYLPRNWIANLPDPLQKHTFTLETLIERKQLRYLRANFFFHLNGENGDIRETELEGLSLTFTLSVCALRSGVEMRQTFKQQNV